MKVIISASNFLTLKGLESCYRITRPTTSVEGTISHTIIITNCRSLFAKSNTKFNLTMNLNVKPIRPEGYV